MVCEKCGRELIDVTTIEDMCEGIMTFVHGGVPYKSGNIPVRIIGNCPNESPETVL